MDCLLAIDQSTSATKAVLFDRYGSEIDTASAEHRQIYPQPGWVEHDADEIWHNALRAMRQLLSRDPELKPVSVSITNQRETIVLFDRATGKPVHHAMVWQCRSGAGVCEALKQAGNEDFVRARTGLPIDPYFSASKLARLIRDNTSIRDGLANGSVLIGTIDAYLIYRLTGGKVFATDATNASRTLLYDINRNAWDERLCALFDVPMKALPEVRASTASYGTMAVEGLPKIPIAGVMGDSQASLFAQRCFAPGSAKVTFGTGSSVLMNTGSKMTLGPEGICTTIGWLNGTEPTYSYEGIITYSAASVAWLKDQLGIIQSAMETESMARSLPDNGGVYLVPAFAGLGAPYWAPTARAAIVGLTAHSDKRHLVRAALESIGYQIADVLDAMRSSSGTRLTSIHADGGPTRNAFLMQFVADVTGVELIVSSVPNCSALGAAMAGALGSGIYQSLDELANLPRKQVVYRPAMNADDVAALRDGWNRAVRQTLAK